MISFVTMVPFLLFLATSISNLEVHGFRIERQYYASSRQILGTRILTLHNSKAEKNKLVGGGYQLIPSGNLQLFDPNNVGMKQGTNELKLRIESGVLFSIPSQDTIAPEEPSQVQLFDAQHWLEHLDVDIPVNLFKNTAPGSATLLGSIKIIGDDAPGDM
jgi:hypothetical protein